MSSEEPEEEKAKVEKQEPKTTEAAEPQELIVTVNAVALTIKPGMQAQPLVPDDEHPDNPDAVAWQRKNGMNKNFTFDTGTGASTGRYVRHEIVGAVSLGNKKAGPLDVPLIGYIVRNQIGLTEIIPGWLLKVS